MKKRLNIVLMLFLAITLSKCTTDISSSNELGNSSDVGNPINSTIIGKIVDSSNVGIPNLRLDLISLDISDEDNIVSTCNTNDSGEYFFKNIANGDYKIAGYKDNKKVVIISSIHVNNETIIDLSSTTSGNVGSIEGYLRFNKSSNPIDDSIRIILKEFIDTTLLLDSGKFILKDVPVAEHRICFYKKSGETWFTELTTATNKCHNVDTVTLVMPFYIKKSTVGGISMPSGDATTSYVCHISDSIIIEMSQNVSEVKGLKITDLTTNLDIYTEVNINGNRISIYHDEFTYSTKYDIDIEIIYDSYSKIKLTNHKFGTRAEPNPFFVESDNLMDKDWTYENFPLDGSIIFYMSQNVELSDFVITKGVNGDTIDINITITDKEIKLTPNAPLENGFMYYVNGAATSTTGLVCDNIYTKFGTSK